MQTIADKHLSKWRYSMEKVLKQSLISAHPGCSEFRPPHLHLPMQPRAPRCFPTLPRTSRRQASLQTFLHFLTLLRTSLYFPAQLRSSFCLHDSQRTLLYTPERHMRQPTKSNHSLKLTTKLHMPNDPGEPAPTSCLIPEEHAFEPVGFLNILPRGPGNDVGTYNGHHISIH
ncbi:hypothetical protein AMELA_G00058270 [Ameiurus melas]|uniref:Uncharacterized protein n=1 Tax=Ameiurus melas TaxID=219545 RepID=A0A7J6B2S4_AMEME|nr:hypothetical protein AMELA_G00058270 [Ameiurus melas]